MTIESPVTIRLITYKSVRHYVGREINSTAHLCKADYIKQQADGTFLCKLLVDCAGYKMNHLIAVQPIDFNISNL